MVGSNRKCIAAQIHKMNSCKTCGYIHIVAQLVWNKIKPQLKYADYFAI